MAMNNNTKARRTHPYLRPEFWADPSNHFWNNVMYSESERLRLALEASIWVEKYAKLNSKNI